MTRKFVKKPLEIEAFRYGYDDTPEWGFSKKIKYWVGFAVIETLEGEMRAEKGDYIIKGIKGEIYPCKADIFLASYEEVAKHDNLFCSTGFKTPRILDTANE